MDLILEVDDLMKKFGGLIALNGVSLHIKRGEILGVIGPNGSGKTTLINVISGIYEPDNGSVYFNGEKINGLKPFEIAQMGIGRTFQIPKLFNKLTVLENLLVPAFAMKSTNYAEKVAEVLKFLELTHLANERAMNLSGGQKKLLEFGRVLMLDPQVVLLDEPFAGVNPAIKDRMQNLIKKLSKKGHSFLVVSHDISSVFNLCRRVIVLSAGKKIFEGPPEKAKDNERVIDAYLGG